MEQEPFKYEARSSDRPEVGAGTNHDVRLMAAELCCLTAAKRRDLFSQTSPGTMTAPLQLCSALKSWLSLHQRSQRSDGDVLEKASSPRRFSHLDLPAARPKCPSVDPALCKRHRSGSDSPATRSPKHEPQDSRRHTRDSAIRRTSRAAEQLFRVTMTRPSPVVLRKDEQRHPVSGEETQQSNCRLEGQQSHGQAVLAHRPKPY